jgi:hypothetical protein
MEKRGKGKEAILLVLGLVLVVVVVFSMIKRPAPAPKQETADTSKTVAKTAAPNKDKATQVADKNAKPELPLPQAVLGGKSPGTSASRNPFTAPPVVVNAAAPGRTTAPVANIQPALGRPNPGFTPGPLPALGTMFSNLLSPTGAPTGAGLAAGKPVDSLQLSGTVMGRSALAVLRKGNTRYFVHRGDPVDGGLVVATINYGQVTLRSKEGKNINLHLGGGGA